MRYCEAYWEDVARVVQHIPNLKDLYNSTILITGGTGMICSAVADVLLFLNKKNNAEIKIILAGRSKERVNERFSEFTEGKDFFFEPYDATIQTDLQVNADYLIHGASNANPVIYAKQPVETMLANIVGINSLLDLAVRMNSRRLLYISSSEVYGNKSELRSYVEDDYGYVDILNQRASYPSAKRAAETLCIAYGQEYGLDTVIARPGHIYGPTITTSDNRASAQFTRNAVAGEDIVLKSAGSQLRSYCYVLDCASAILTVLINGETGNAYNISNPNSIVTISDIAKALANAANKKVVYDEMSELEKKGANMMTNSSLNSKKLEALGWSAEFSLEEGTRKTVEILKE
jgi:nucleoside-diphosphate-sugar epimerase